jgi:hypothetical protein
LRLAAQVQARTQQLATAKGQGEQLLDRAHGPNLTAPGRALQLYTRESGTKSPRKEGKKLSLGAKLAMGEQELRWSASK